MKKLIRKFLWWASDRALDLAFWVRRQARGTGENKLASDADDLAAEILQDRREGRIRKP